MMEALTEFANQEGEIRTGYFWGSEITYKLIDGKATLGDMILMDGPLPKEPEISTNGAGRYSSTWPGNRVYYAVASNVNRSWIDSAARTIEQYTNIDMYELTGSELANANYYINIFKGTGCYATIGYQGNVQQMSIGSNCGTSTTIHEFLHAFGLLHEQVRSDRDNHVYVYLNNVDASKRHNFNKHNTTTINGYNYGSYDANSIMHYSSTAFSNNGNWTIAKIGPAPNYQAQYISFKTQMTNGDINLVNYIHPSSNYWNNTWYNYNNLRVYRYNGGWWYQETNGQWNKVVKNGSGWAYSN